jgi:hypothetical protein
MFSSYGIAVLMMGIDSPVNIDSFKMAEPFNNTQSQGTVQSF